MFVCVCVNLIEIKGNYYMVCDLEQSEKKEHESSVKRANEKKGDKRIKSWRVCNKRRSESSSLKIDTRLCVCVIPLIFLPLKLLFYCLFCAFVFSYLNSLKSDHIFVPFIIDRYFQKQSNGLTGASVVVAVIVVISQFISNSIKYLCILNIFTD